MRGACARQDSNLRPLPPQGSALSPELRARTVGQCSRALWPATSSSAPSGTSTRTYARASPRTALVTRPTARPSKVTSSAWRSTASGASPSSSSTRSVRFTWPRLRRRASGSWPGIAALRERDRPLVEAGLGREDPVVDLAAPARRAREDPQPLEVLVGRGRLEPRVEHLDRRHAVVVRRDPVGLAEDDRRGVLLQLDLAA